MYNNWASDPEVTKYLTWPVHPSAEISREIINLWVPQYSNPENYQWAVEWKDNHEVIGSVSFVHVDSVNENCEIGYCIGRDYWGKGIVTEAAAALIRFALKEVGFARVTGRHDVNNPASGRVMEKCNMTYEGTLRKIIKNSNGDLADCKYYSILQEEL